MTANSIKKIKEEINYYKNCFKLLEEEAIEYNDSIIDNLDTDLRNFYLNCVDLSNDYICSEVKTVKEYTKILQIKNNWKKVYEEARKLITEFKCKSERISESNLPWFNCSGECWDCYAEGCPNIF